MIGLAIIMGLIIGDRLARRIDVQTARRLMLILAYIGSTATVVRGVATLLH